MTFACSPCVGVCVCVCPEINARGRVRDRMVLVSDIVVTCGIARTDSHTRSSWRIVGRSRLAYVLSVCARHRRSHSVFRMRTPPIRQFGTLPRGNGEGWGNVAELHTKFSRLCMHACVAPRPHIRCLLSQNHFTCKHATRPNTPDGMRHQ